MNNTELCRVLVTETRHALADPACKPIIGNDHVRFEWQTDYGRKIAYVSIIRHGHSYKLSYYSALCHDRVELIHALALGLSRRSYAIRATLIGGEHPALKYIAVENKADAERWCAIMVAHVQGAGAAWLNAPVDLGALNTRFNSNPEVEVMGCAYALSRAEKGVIIATLCDDPVTLNLIEAYRNMLLKDDILLTYDDVVSWLGKHDQASLMHMKMNDLVP
jgi:hypothetical protein